jgi:DNA-3-methyladenine glycosylase II
MATLALHSRAGKNLKYPAPAMVPRIDTETDLSAAVTWLTERDPRLAALYAVTGSPPLRRRAAGFEGLATIVVSQQLSTASAGAIWARLAAAFEPFDHASVARARPDRLRRLGLSAGKVRTLKAIAKAIGNGALDFDALGELPADDAHRALTELHGIGPWTADIYLLSCLGHADAWPAGDLALQEACRLALALRTRPTAKQMGPLAEDWRPYRGVAARLLWTYYRAVKKRDGAPIQPANKNSPARNRRP